MPVQISVIGAVAAALLTAAIVAFITTPVVRTLAFRVGRWTSPGTTAGCTTTPFPGWGGWPSFSALSSAP